MDPGGLGNGGHEDEYQDENGHDAGHDDRDEGHDPPNQRGDSPRPLNLGLPQWRSTRTPLHDLDLAELEQIARIDFLQRDIQFIRRLRDATLDEPGGLSEEALKRLRNPPQTTPEIKDPVIELALSMYLVLEHSSQETYERIRRAVEKCFPGSIVPSLCQIKTMLADITGVKAFVNDMCINSCIAFTGPYADLEQCPECQEHRYDQIQFTRSSGRVKAPRAVFNTIPIGPQLQALYRNPQTATKLHYRYERTQQILEELRRTDGVPDAYNDILSGEAYLEACRTRRIDKNDILLIFSIDGAQLYEKKESDCWIYIWIIVEHSPGERYKKNNVLPGAIIPGPKKPGYIESFLYPGFHHLSALQREGLAIWDSSKDKIFISRPFLFLSCGDGPGLLCTSNLVGHCGKHGCRMYCKLQGRRKPRGSQYYPVLLLPHNYDVQGCLHGDISPYDIATGTSHEYAEKLKFLMGSLHKRQYDERRLQTGIVGPSILLGLQPEKILGIPECFSSEIMHYAGANMASLFVDLWHGKMDCDDRTDSKNDWVWRVLVAEKWDEHGRAVAACKRHLPGCFDVAPRNPAEKMNSFYKAREYITWLYYLCPALLYSVLPYDHWRNFCKFAAALRIMSQYNITPVEVSQACEFFADWEEEFELLYYQRRVDRIHFVRPCVHLTNHLALEATRVGAPICSSQWTMERTIGNLGQEIRQPSDPFSNLAQQGIRRCQTNALKALFPRFNNDEKQLPRGAEDLGGGYILLHKSDRRPFEGSHHEREAMARFLQQPAPARFQRWARLQLPNDQIARSAWTETQRAADSDQRISRHVKVFFMYIFYELLHHNEAQ